MVTSAGTGTAVGIGTGTAAAAEAAAATGLYIDAWLGYEFPWTELTIAFG